MSINSVSEAKRWMRIEWAVLAVVIGIVVSVLGGSTFMTIAGIVIIVAGLVHGSLAFRHRRSISRGRTA